MSYYNSNEYIINKFVPHKWRRNLSKQLTQDEKIIIAFEVDLDDKLYFSLGLIVVTNNRLLSCSPNNKQWKTWDYVEGLKLVQNNYANVGCLELVNDQEVLNCWRFTLGKSELAAQLVEYFHKSYEYAISIDHPQEDFMFTLNESKESDMVSLNSSEMKNFIWMFKQLFSMAYPYRYMLLLGLTLMLIGTAANLVPPYLTMPLMDNILIPIQNGKPVKSYLIVLYLSGLLGFSILAWFLSCIKSYVSSFVSEKIGFDLRTKLYQHLLKLPLSFYSTRRTGDLISRVSSETLRICSFISVQLSDFLTDVCMFMMTVIILFTIDPVMALATLIPLPVIFFMMHVVRGHLGKYFNHMDRVWAEVTNILSDTVPGIRVVKAFVQEKRESLRFRKANKHNLEVNNRINKLWSLFYPSLSLVNELGIVLIWGFAIYQITNGRIKVGVIIAFISYTSRFYGRIESMVRMMSSTQRCFSSMRRIFDIFDYQSDLPEAKNPMLITRLKGDINIKNVNFNYGGRPILQNINLHIKSGEMIGLVGHSGAGKSSLVNLICRFYDVSSGEILVDHHDVRAFSTIDYRRHIGLVSQEPFLFFGTIAQNIAYGKSDASHAEIIAAAKAANAHEFILAMPLGYDSMVSERGQNLSGGERQRISIARAILIDPRILILDEATSSVDSNTEYEIQKALENLRQGRTTIAIAHRLSTLHLADRIVVMDHGEIVEVGNHKELMKQKGAYHYLYTIQSSQAMLREGINHATK